MAQKSVGLRFYQDPNEPKITKIYYKSHREIVIKRIVNNQPDIWYIDLRHIAPLRHRHENIENSDRYISIRLYGVIDSQLPNSYWGKYQNYYWTAVRTDNKFTFPRYVYVDSTETETEETDYYRPEWSKFHDRPVIAKEWHKRIGLVAHRFAQGFNPAWSFLNWHDGGDDPYVNHDDATATDAQKEAVQRHINTANACRLLIGRCWCIVDDHAKSTAPQSAKEIMDHEALIVKLEKLFPTPYAVQEFHNRHAPDTWKDCMNADDGDCRKIYWWTKDYKKGQVLYDINRQHVKTVSTRNDQNELEVSQVIDHAKAKAEYLEILSCYRKAFSYPHPDAAGFVTREYF